MHPGTGERNGQRRLKIRGTRGQAQFSFKGGPQKLLHNTPIVSGQPNLDRVGIPSCKGSSLSVSSITPGHVPCHCLTSKRLAILFSFMF